MLTRARLKAADLLAGGERPGSPDRKQGGQRPARRPFGGSGAYWEKRYAEGGDSGRGSRGPLAQYKADFVNDFIGQRGVSSVTELGCGDGAQIALGAYPCYTGMDVSATAIRSCVERFRGDEHKTFLVYASGALADPRGLLASDLAMSLDVLFHLVEQEVFEAYLHDLFGLARRYVLIYASEERPETRKQTVTNRPFTNWVDRNMPEWTLEQVFANPHAWNGDPHTSTHSQFYLYVRRSD